MMKSCWAKCWRSICAYPLCGKFQEDDDGSLNEGQNWTISHQAQETVVFERLPPILETISLPPLTQEGIDSMIDRSQLRYADSIGKGWFGWVISASYRGKKVVVQTLREEANGLEQDRFINEAKMRKGADGHPNILAQIGVSFNSLPLIIVLEATNSDLKTFLRNACDQISTSDLQVSFCRDIIKGLGYLHDMLHVPLDLGARTCQVTQKLSIKLGDYGLASTLHPDDYINNFPLRWFSPQMRLKVAELGSQLDTASPMENLWSLGITLWEVMTMAQKQPFCELTDEEFVVRSHENCSLAPIDQKGVIGETLGIVIGSCTQMQASHRLPCHRLSRYLDELRNEC